MCYATTSVLSSSIVSATTNNSESDVNNSAMHCEILLTIGRLERYGFAIKAENGWRDGKPQVTMQL